MMGCVRVLLQKFCILLISLAVSCHGRSVLDLTGSQANMQKGLKYLKKYNYISDQMNSNIVSDLVDPADFEATIRRMQMYMGPNVTVNGRLDEATLAQMDKPRCGVPDPSGQGDETIGGRLRRYSHSGGRWEQRTLTYRIENTPTELNLAEVRDAVRRAFDVWQELIPRNFVEVFSGQADIMMSFGEYYHGDAYPFDGVQGTLAHAFGPYGYGDPIEGDVHFDDAEYFTIRTYDGINLFLVAAHEIGHSLGLGHSTDPTALMAPFYQGYIPNFQLPYDDVLGIQTLYGGRPREDIPPTRPTTTTKPPTTELPIVCQISFDSVAYIRGEIFAFKGDRLWRVRSPGEPLSPPEGYLSTSLFQDLPSGVQAAYERYYDQKILFFRGTEYWVYDGVTPLPGYPRPISDLSKALPGDLQAAATWTEHNKVYFFKDGKVYRYDEYTKEVDAGWPYPINSVFPGVPGELDGAFRYHDKMAYFIKGKYYFIYSDTLRKVIDPTPRGFVADFFGCDPDLYNFKGVNNTDYDAFGIDNGGSTLSISIAFNSLLLLIALLFVSS